VADTTAKCRGDYLVRVEELDLAIVRQLAQEGRMSFTDLGRETGLSTSAVHQRVRRLEQRQVITGYAAQLDHAQLGFGLTAIVMLKPMDPSAPDDTPERLADIAAIEACYSVAGDYSYVLLVRVATTVDLEDLLAQIRSRGNVSTNSTIVLSTPYERRTRQL
jgi:Lrp/AsnC family transcriptional regulator, leucine-responsive regulatory protein